MASLLKDLKYYLLYGQSLSADVKYTIHTSY